MKGIRVYAGEDGRVALPDGGYGQDSRGVWWVRPPGHTAGPLTPTNGGAGWTITEYDDGSITVSPSIHFVNIWHGYLERGVWREC